MATSSFSKNFIITSQKEADSIVKAMEAISDIEIDRSMTSPERKREGVLKLKQILSR